MPHAIEMPSVLADDSGGQHATMVSSSSSSGRPPFDLPSHLRHSYDKTNGTPRTSSHASIKNTAIEGEYADAVGGSVQGEQQAAHDASLSMIPNGRTSAGSWEQGSRVLRSDEKVSGLGGGVNGTTENGRRSPGPSLGQNGISRTSNGDRGSVVSINGVITNGRTSNDTSKLNGSPVEPFNRSDVPHSISTNPQSTGPLTYNSTLTPASPGSGSIEIPPRAQTSSPHRFSSPPTYTGPLAPTQSSSSLNHSGPPTLKHRHTLQVPKLGPGRSSKDGEEAIYTSGRFSPTTIPGGVRRGSLSLNRRNTQSIHSNMPHDEVPPDEDAMRWAEAVRQKRASKRKRKDDEEDDRVVVGTKVDQNHVNWVTAYNMLTGIRFTVSRTNAKMDRPLTDADFEARHKFSFDM